MVQARYQYAIDVMLTRLRMIDADLTEKNERPLIRNLCSRIKTAESIVKKLERKEREVTFETAVNTLNDIAGVRVVCYFADDIYQEHSLTKTILVKKDAGKLEAVEKATREYADVIAGVDQKMQELRKKIQKM